MKERTKVQEQKFLHQKMVNMLPSNVVIGEKWSTRFFDEKYYTTRTLKQFIFALEWLKQNRDSLPNGEIRFHGKCFTIRQNGKLVMEICFKGSKLGPIYNYTMEQ